MSWCLFLCSFSCLVFAALLELHLLPNLGQLPPSFLPLCTQSSLSPASGTLVAPVGPSDRVPRGPGSASCLSQPAFLCCSEYCILLFCARVSWRFPRSVPFFCLASYLGYCASIPKISVWFFISLISLLSLSTLLYLFLVYP